MERAAAEAAEESRRAGRLSPEHLAVEAVFMWRAAGRPAVKRPARPEGTESRRGRVPCAAEAGAEAQATPGPVPEAGVATADFPEAEPGAEAPPRPGRPADSVEPAEPGW